VVGQSIEALQDLLRWALAHDDEEVSQVGEKLEACGFVGFSLWVTRQL